MNPIPAILLAVTVLLATPTWALNSLPFMKDSFLNLKEDLAEAKINGKTLMVLYEQDGCPYCTEMHKTTFVDPEVVQLLKNKFDVVQLDIWGGREIVDISGGTHTEKQWARKLGIQFSPMIVFFDASGKEVFRIPGYYKPALFKTALHYVANRKYLTLPFRDYASQQVSLNIPHINVLSTAPANLRSALAASATSGKGVALLFEESQCRDCQEFRTGALQRKDIADRLGAHYQVVPIDIAGTRTVVDVDGVSRSGPQLAAKYSIQTTPTMVFIGPQGNEVLRHNSYLKPDHFLNLVIYLTSDARLKHKSFQDWLRVKDAVAQQK